MTKKRILAVSGSTRKNSSNKVILEYISEKYSEMLQVEIYDGIDKLPHFNPDLDHENPPETVKAFRKQISWADGIIICTPEYVFSLPGSLKNAIDWNVSTILFSQKPVAIIVAAASGEKALESLALVMTTIEATIAENAKLLIKSAQGKIDKNAQIKQEVKEKIAIVIESLLETISKENS